MSQAHVPSSYVERPPFYLTLHENLRHHVSVRPEKIAVVYEGRSYTFKEVYEDACRIAASLQERGIGQGDNVGIYLRNCAVYISIYYALSMAGAVAVPLNYMLRSEQLGASLQSTDCKFLFTDLPLYEHVRELGPSFAGAVPVGLVDGGPEGSAERVSDWLNLWVSCQEPAVKVSIHDPMMILFSSGTTSAPQGIVLSHLNRVLYFFALGMECGIRYNEVNLCTTPLYHNGAVFFVFNNLYFGSTTAIHRKFDVSSTVSDIERYRVTNAFLVPTQMQQLVQSDERVSFDLTSFRVIATADAPLSSTTKEAVLECFPGIELNELYGLTETGAITNLRPDDQFRKVRCAGKAFINMEFRIVDENARDVPAGDVGEIIARGPTLFEGYYEDEEATRAVLRNGWFHTGDLGKVDEEGYLYIVDRLKDMIISGGVNIYPEGIENVIYGLPEVSDVAVIGVPDDKWGEAVHAVVVRRVGRGLSAERVIERCLEKLPAYQVPRTVEFRNEVPRNPSGKLLKRVLREEFWAGRGTRV